MLEWKDATSYSRSDKDRVPRLLELNIRGMRIVVHRIVRCEGWYLSCYKLDIENRPLASNDLESAKTESLKTIIKNIEVLEQIKYNLEKGIS